MVRLFRRHLKAVVCGYAATALAATIPVMALAVRKLTRDDGLALLAAAATALNPLLAYYMVFVHQYTFEFLLTAVFLLAAVRLFGNGPEIEPRRFARVAAPGAVVQRGFRRRRVFGWSQGWRS